MRERMRFSKDGRHWAVDHGCDPKTIVFRPTPALTLLYKLHGSHPNHMIIAPELPAHEAVLLDNIDPCRFKGER